MAADAERTIRREIRRALPNETGGLLLGWSRPDLDVVVVAEATGPGNNAVQTPTRLTLDTEDLQGAVDDAFDRTSGDVDYLGDWHVHHEARPRPSTRDQQSLVEMTAKTGLNMTDPVLVIVGRSPRTGRHTWHAWHGRSVLPARVVRPASR